MRRLRRALRALWPKRLAAELIALLLFALVASQVVTLAILLDERRHALRAADRAQVLARTASIVQLMKATPGSLHPHILRTASSPRVRFWLDERTAVDASIEAHRHNPLQQRLNELLDGSAQQVLGALTEHEREMWDWFEPDGDLEEAEGAVGRWALAERRDAPAAGLAGRRAAVSDRHGRHGGGAQPDRRADDPADARPMADLAAAAERLGRGEAVPPVPERGPEDVRRTTRAFNRMHGRLQRFVQDRTRMLAAISHDLRTPHVFAPARRVRGRRGDARQDPGDPG
jgi:signal transduction histidine kinase